MIIDTGKTLIEFLDNLSCSKDYFFDILTYNKMDGYAYCSRNIEKDIDILYNGAPFLLFRDDKIISHFHYVQISSLEELADLIKRYITLKAFL